MPRYTLLSLAAVFALALSFAAVPVQAQIAWEGSVLPTSPTGFPVIGGSDSDNDGVVDFLFPGGNGIITDGINQTDPTGATGIGLPWNASQVWRAFDSAQNILVGDGQQSGNLSISAGGVLRYQHLVLGGVSALTNSNSRLNFDIDSPTDFTVSTYLNTVQPGTGGVGVMTVSGFGSLFNNDPNLLPQSAQVALNLAAGRATTAFQVITDLGAEVDESNNPFSTFVTRRDNVGGFDVVVGLNGSGVLNVNQGGRVEVQDALMVGVDSQSNGSVVIDGVGSALVAYGRTRLQATGSTLNSTLSNETASFVGGRGNGSLSVTGGARADFFNGLSIGAPTGAVLAALSAPTDLGDGSGVVTLTGAGSVLNAYASTIGGNFSNLALAVGEQRASLTTPFDPTDEVDASLQTGTLNIGNGAVVTTATRLGAFGSNADAAIGKRGKVFLTGGQLQVSDNLDNDGNLSGYGVVRASTMATSVYSVIRGGDANAQNPALSDPLTLVLLNNSDTALLNRGLIEGRVALDVSGDIVNEGQIETSGEVFAQALFTNTTSRIRSAPGGTSPLRLRLNDNTAAGVVNNGDNFGALHNRGSIEGNLDFIVTGGVVNGDNYLPTSTAPTNGSAAGGSILGTGRILAGTFLNNAAGEVRVRQGESLSINVNAATSTSFPSGAGIPTVGGGSLAYRSLNLGSISVTGGELEIGYLPPSGAPIDFFVPGGGAFNNAEVFTNARYLVPDTANPGQTLDNTAGTIVANDATLRFTTGLLNMGGVLAFTGGSNIVNGPVFNADVTYGSGASAINQPGTIVVSGDGTSVTFEDDVINEGEIGIGPFGSVVNFLGDLTNTGNIEVAFDALGTSGSAGAYITVQGGVQIQGGTIGFAFINQPAVIDNNFSIALLTAGDLSTDSQFTSLDLPSLPAGKYWDVVYDTVNDEVRLEVVMANVLGADFTGDGIVSQADVDVWIRNAGIVSGASAIMGDADLDGDVDLHDYDVLMAQLFTGVPVGVGGVFSVAVPEPASALLLCLAAFGAGAARRR